MFQAWIVLRCDKEERHIGRLLSGIMRQTIEGVEIMCKSQYMKYFHAEAEIEGVRSRWMDRVHNGELPAAVCERLARASVRKVSQQ